MSVLKAVIVLRPPRAETLCLRLLEAGWAEALAVREARGCGRQKEWLGDYAAAPDALPRAIVECVVPAARRDELVQIVLAACRTGRIGDGKILLLPVLAAFDA